MTLTDTTGPIADARLAGAQMEWERHDRERRAAVTLLTSAIAQLELALLEARGILSHFESADWIRSPREMAQLRTPTPATSEEQVA